jgi:phosphoglucosamine mutase
VVLGGDTRESTPRIVADLAAGLSQGGCGVAAAGVITTPGVAELVLELDASAGVAVSASHNPYEDNGIKIFGPDGRKWPDDEEELLERALSTASTATRADSRPARPGPGPRRDLRLAPARQRSRGPRLALRRHGRRERRRVPDRPARAVARRRGGEGDPRRAGRTQHQLGLRRAPPRRDGAETRASGASIGVAFDGDADRSIFADESGRILDGDDILWIVARDWKRRGRLTAGGVVGTVMSNYGLEAALSREGIPFRRAAVGDRNVARHDGRVGRGARRRDLGSRPPRPALPRRRRILTALVMCEILRREGRPLSTLATLEKMPQTLRNIRVARRVPVAEIESLRDAAARGEQALRSRGRVFLRYSGTEPLLRILVEGPDAVEVHAIADDIESAARSALT